MSLKDALEAAQQEPKPKFEQWVADLPEQDRADLLAFAPSQRLSHRAFHDVLKAHGARVSRETMADWRKANGYVTR